MCIVLLSRCSRRWRGSPLAPLARPDLLDLRPPGTQVFARAADGESLGRKGLTTSLLRVVVAQAQQTYRWPRATSPAGCSLLATAPAS